MSGRGETGQYNGEHSLIINDRHKNVRDTHLDWHLVPTGILAVEPPSVKTKIVENPGSDGVIDLTEAVSGFPIYGQRQGSWDFYILNDWQSWDVLYSEILNFLHGKQLSVRLTDDNDYFYRGRMSVNSFKSDKSHSQITLDYDFEPYKLSRWTSVSPSWSWDKFVFSRDTISRGIFYNLNASINGSAARMYTFTGRQVGRKPTTPVFRILSGTVTYIRLFNEELNPSNGLYTANLTMTPTGSNMDSQEAGCYHFLDMIFTGFRENNVIKVSFKGSPDARVSIEFRPGML